MNLGTRLVGCVLPWQLKFLSLVNFARIVPHGLLVFFPSYESLTQCIDLWKTPVNFIEFSWIKLFRRVMRHRVYGREFVDTNNQSLNLENRINSIVLFKIFMPKSKTPRTTVPSSSLFAEARYARPASSYNL
jgi:hypothetical protein